MNEIADVKKKKQWLEARATALIDNRARERLTLDKYMRSDIFNLFSVTSKTYA